MEKRIYTPESNIQRPWIMLRDMLADMRRGQDLALRLTIRDIKALYRQSFLGLLWAFIIPIANTLTWIFLNSSGIVSVETTALPYPVYVFTGTMIWAIFMESMQAPLTKTTQNKSVLAKVNFPREAIIMSAVYESVFNACIKGLILIVAVIALGYAGGWSMLLFPVALLAIILAGTTIGLMLTPIGTLYADISKAIPLIMQFLMFTAPVVFTIPAEGKAAWVIRHNPLTPLVSTARDWLTGGAPEFLNGFWLVTAIFAVVFLLVLIAYRLAMPILIERMNA